ncbi:MAG TPA: hypothetical protein VI299_18205, partial [Polyangiales bacterium]
MSSWLGRTCRLTSLLALACGRPASEPLPRQVPPREVPASTPVPSPSSALPAGVLSRELSHEDVLWDVFELDLTKVELRLYGQADPTLRRF